LSTRDQFLLSAFQISLLSVFGSAFWKKKENVSAPVKREQSENRI